MEKYSCKLCFRNFTNGKALGGHMRSHMMSFYAAQKEKNVETVENDSQPSDDFQSSSSTSQEEDYAEDEQDEEKEVLSCGFRENPKRSTHFVDPKFFFASGSVVFQDRESETESNPNPFVNPVFRRSKRIRKSRNSVKEEEEVIKKPKCENGEKIGADQFSDQPLSSISDTPEEDVAYWLMMLSRDTWQRGYEYEEDRERNKYEDDDYFSDEIKVAKSTKVRGKYRCETCNKVFKSYQALGGHRANHKKIKAPTAVEGGGVRGSSSTTQVEEKIHECPICFRVFSSGQALGGHKRSHFVNGGLISANVNSVRTPPAKTVSRIGETLNIDLNLPAPVDDDDEISQIVNSPLH